MGWLILFVAIALVVFGVGLFFTALRWLLIVGAVLLVIGLVTGWLRRSNEPPTS
jgi:hypothetical protein